MEEIDTIICLKKKQKKIKKIPKKYRDAKKIKIKLFDFFSLHDIKME